jgi:shikimate kinase
MPSAADPTIVLLGMMGAGKSTVGRALAQRTGRPYLDNDRLVREATGRAPEEIDAHDGTDALHAAEAEALRYALSLEGPLIAGAAAGVVDDPGCQGLLRTCPVVVYLRARPETLRDRIGSGSGRRRDATDLAWLRARHAERDTRYQALATLTVDTDELEPGVVADEILAAIEGAAAG